MERGGIVTILDSGDASVLANDFDPEGDALVAVLERDKSGSGSGEITLKPNHGSLELRADGTFVYRHDGGGSPEDHFDYFAFDGTEYSDRTRVTIKIVESGQDGSDDDDDSGDDDSGGDDSGSDSSRGDDDADDAPGPSGGGQQAPSDLSVTVAVSPNPALLDATASWEIRIANSGPSDVGPVPFTARWYASEAPLSLAAPLGCSVSANQSLAPEIRCTTPSLRSKESARVTIRSNQAAAGDNAVVVGLDADDERADNNRAAVSLNVAQAFGPSPSQVLKVAGRAAAAGDFDGDGAVDLAVIGADRTVIYQNTGQQFSSKGAALEGSSGGSIVLVADWNRDNAPDIAVAGADSNGGRLYLNDGNGGFGSPIALPAERVNAGVAVDLNGDAAMELVFATDSGLIEVGNGGSGQLSSRQLLSRPARHIASADLDQNGFEDLVVVLADAPAVQLMLNTGTGFSESTFEAADVAAVTTADADDDGDYDLILAVDGFASGAPANRLLRNQNGTEFSDVGSIGASPTLVILEGDLNGDRSTDLITLNETAAHQLYLNGSGGEFRLHEAQIRATQVSGGLLTDLTNDGALDLVLAREQAGVVELYFGIGRGSSGGSTGGSAPRDVTPPTITLIGETSLKLTVNGTYQEPGASAMDDVDGDLTDAIVIDNPVDPRIIGTYEVVYRVTDSAGNSSEAVRIVTVEAAEETSGGGGAFAVWMLGALTTLLIARRLRTGTPIAAPHCEVHRLRVKSKLLRVKRTASA